jgi:predicted nucleic acid-binding protein
MNYHYLDASAWVKRYSQEIGTVWVQDFFTQNPTIVSATLGLVEVTATFSRKHRGRQINVDQLNQIRQHIQVDWLNFIQIQLTESVMHEATQLTSQLALRGADAIHLAAAKTFQNQINVSDTLIFITADQELKTAAQMIGMSIIDPEVEDRQIISP